MEVEIRTARRADLDRIGALWLALLREHAVLDARFVVAGDALQRWKNDAPFWLSDADRHLAVAVHEGETVGFAAAQRWTPPPIYAAVPEVHLDELYVVPAWRGRGLGRRLAGAVRAWAEAGGAERLRLGVLAANADARAFWERLGAHPLAITYTLALTPGASPEKGGRLGF